MQAEKVFNQDLYFKRTVKYVGEPMSHLESIASSAVSLLQCLFSFSLTGKKPTCRSLYWQQNSHFLLLKIRCVLPSRLGHLLLFASQHQGEQQGMSENCCISRESLKKMIPTYISLPSLCHVELYEILVVFSCTYWNLWTFPWLCRLIAKYRPTMPVLSVVIPQLKSNQLRWTFSGASEVKYLSTYKWPLVRQILQVFVTNYPVDDNWQARQSLIVRGIFPMLADPRHPVRFFFPKSLWLWLVPLHILHSNIK